MKISRGKPGWAALALIVAGCATVSDPPERAGHAAKSDLAATEDDNPLARTGRWLEEGSAARNLIVRRSFFERVIRTLDPYQEKGDIDTPAHRLHLGVAHFLIAADETGPVERHLDAALVHLERAAALPGANDQIWFWLCKAHEYRGSLHWGAGRMDDAATHYDRYRHALAQLPPGELPGELQLATLKYADATWHAGRREQALALYDQLSRWARENAEAKGSAMVVLGLHAAYQVIALHALREHGVPDARRFFEHALEWGRTGFALNTMNQPWLLPSVAITAHWAALAAMADDAPHDALRILDEADTWMRRLMTVNPKFARASTERMGDLRRAAAVWADPTPAPGDLPLAFESLQRIGFSLAKHESPVLRRLGASYLRKAAAVQQELASLPIAPTPHRDAAAEMGMAMAEEVEGRIENARDRYRRVGEMLPASLPSDTPNPWRALGDAARESVAELAEGPRDPKALGRLARLGLGESPATIARAAMSGENPNADLRIRPSVEWSAVGGATHGEGNVGYRGTLWRREGNRVRSITIEQTPSPHNR